MVKSKILSKGCGIRVGHLFLVMNDATCLVTLNDIDRVTFSIQIESVVSTLSTLDIAPLLD